MLVILHRELICLELRMLVVLRMAYNLSLEYRILNMVHVPILLVILKYVTFHSVLLLILLMMTFQLLLLMIGVLLYIYLLMWTGTRRYIIFPHYSSIVILKPAQMIQLHLVAIVSEVRQLKQLLLLIHIIILVIA